MADFRLLNGKTKVTMIERFDCSICLICPDRTVKNFSGIQECMEFAKENGWEINIEHIRKKVV